MYTEYYRKFAVIYETSSISSFMHVKVSVKTAYMYTRIDVAITLNLRLGTTLDPYYGSKGSHT